MSKEYRFNSARDRVANSKARPNTVHVITSKEGWAIKREGTKKASVVLSTKADAVARGKDMSGVRNVIVHKKDGTVERWSKSKK